MSQNLWRVDLTICSVSKRSWFPRRNIKCCRVSWQIKCCMSFLCSVQLFLFYVVPFAWELDALERRDGREVVYEDDTEYLTLERYCWAYRLRRDKRSVYPRLRKGFLRVSTYLIVWRWRCTWTRRECALWETRPLRCDRSGKDWLQLILHGDLGTALISRERFFSALHFALRSQTSMIATRSFFYHLYDILHDIRASMCSLNAGFLKERLFFFFFFFFFQCTHVLFDNTRQSPRDEYNL